MSKLIPVVKAAAKVAKVKKPRKIQDGQWI
jgi:hypothetical protein